MSHNVASLQADIIIMLETPQLLGLKYANNQLNTFISYISINRYSLQLLRLLRKSSFGTWDEIILNNIVWLLFQSLLI